jgi:hypothetical protein
MTNPNKMRKESLEVTSLDFMEWIYSEPVMKIDISRAEALRKRILKPVKE